MPFFQILLFLVSKINIIHIKHSIFIVNIKHCSSMCSVLQSNAIFFY